MEIYSENTSSAVESTWRIWPSQAILCQQEGTFGTYPIDLILNAMRRLPVSRDVQLIIARAD
jgi:hypothetical protein